jgi:citrate/tricarballylate utilization protein
MSGFLLCFASTASTAVLHYVFAMPAPFGLHRLPKLLGPPGGLKLATGCAGLAWLKTRVERDLGARRIWGGEMAFVLLLCFVAVLGLALDTAGGTGAMPVLLG